MTYIRFRCGTNFWMGYYLGVDVGTTTIKTVLINCQTRSTDYSVEKKSEADLQLPGPEAASEQSVLSIVKRLEECLSRLPNQQLAAVRAIAVSGQMHGLVLWRDIPELSRNNETSNLVTWQDGRCTSEFLSQIPPHTSHLNLSSGQGCPTILWLQRNEPDEFATYNRAGTVQDFIVTMLCGLQRPVMTVHNAASWGYYDTRIRAWNHEILESVDFPIKLLPEVTEPGTVAGILRSDWCGIRKGVPVTAAMGDLQCSVLSVMQQGCAVLNMSTSCQLAYVMPVGFSPVNELRQTGTEYFPYFDNRYIAVAASLNGGNVLATFVKMLQQWTTRLTGEGIHESGIWNLLIKECDQPQNYDETPLIIQPTVFGERHMPDKKASISGIGATNTSLGTIYRTLCTSLVTNLHSMLSAETLTLAGIHKILGSGTCLVRNNIIQEAVRNTYQLPLKVSEDGNAAVGAVLAARFGLE